MAGITSAGIGTGIDINGLVSQLVAAEAAPQTLRLDRRESTLHAKFSAIGTLKGALSAFKNSLSALNNPKTFETKRTASSSNSEIFSASAKQDAIAASYQVEVQKLGQAQKLASAGFTDPTTAIGTGTLTFQFGDPTKAAQTVTIDSGDDSLEGIMRAVNDANIGVHASIVNGDSGYQLVFASPGVGTDNSLKVTVAESPAAGSDTDTTGLSQLAYDPDAAVGAGKNMTELVAAQDAVVLIDGITVTRSSNTIDDAIDGVVLNLAQAEPGSKETLTIGESSADVTPVVDTFVSEYNNLVGSINSLGGYDAETKVGGPLLGDASLRTVSMQLRGMIGSIVPGTDGNKYRALVDVGIKTESNGTLSFDKAKFSAALKDDFESVTRLFGAAGEADDPLIDYVSSGDETKEGAYDISISALASQGAYSDTAASVSSLIVDATNDAFTLRVDGVTSGTISLGQRTYASGDALAAELQSRINGDSALKDAGASLVVEYDSGANRFVFTSNQYGSDSEVEFLTVEDAAASAAIGLTANATAATAGEDVAGTIGTLAGIGDGRYLVADGGASGLKIQVHGGAVGDRGQVVFTRGISYRLNEFLDSILASDGFLSSRSDSIDGQIKEIGEDREKLAERLERLEQRYMAQFVAMDAMVSQLQTTSNYLANQLDSLPGMAYKPKES